MPRDARTVLAIETTVAGGSIALLHGDDEIAAISGPKGVSRAEDLLINIQSLLAENNVSRSDLDMIAVSCGPGSYTGIRIGIATALGLGRAMSIECVGVSVLFAMAYASKSSDVLAAIPFGKNEYAVQRFRKEGEEVRNLDNPVVRTESEYVASLRELKETSFIFHPDITAHSEPIRSSISANDRIETCHANLATLVGRFALRCGTGEAIHPIYLRHPQKSFP